MSQRNKPGQDMQGKYISDLEARRVNVSELNVCWGSSFVSKDWECFFRLSKTVCKVFSFKLCRPKGQTSNAECVLYISQKTEPAKWNWRRYLHVYLSVCLSREHIRKRLDVVKWNILVHMLFQGCELWNMEFSLTTRGPVPAAMVIHFTGDAEQFTHVYFPTTTVIPRSV